MITLIVAGVAIAVGLIAESCGGKEQDEEKPPAELMSEDPPVCKGEKTYDGFKYERCENSERLFWTSSDCYDTSDPDLTKYHFVRGFSCHLEKAVQKWKSADYAKMCTSYNDDGSLSKADSMVLCRLAHLYANWEFLDAYPQYANRPCVAHNPEELASAIKLAKGDVEFTRCYEWILESGRSIYYCSRPTWAYEQICLSSLQ